MFFKCPVEKKYDSIFSIHMSCMTLQKYLFEVEVGILSFLLFVKKKRKKRKDSAHLVWVSTNP